MNFTPFDHECMAEALRLAERGSSSCQPNPRVGCIIARQGKVVGRGWHERAGEEHAEVRALTDAGAQARGATAYVTLEPCSHHGRTPPCTQALIDAGVGEVIAATADPNMQVDGQGFEQLQASGIRVRHGLMAGQARELNPGFFSRLKRQRPWVRVKMAHSLDGRTALRNGQSQWISSAESRADVQSWRARSCAILTGIGTLLADDPSLNVRTPDAVRQPLRVIVDSQWRTPGSARTLQLPGRVLVAGREDLAAPSALASATVELLPLPQHQERVELESLFRELARRELNEVQVEAGAVLAGALLKARLVDEILLYQAPSLLGGDARGMFALGDLEDMSQRVQLEWVDADRVGPDWRLRLRPVYGES